MEEAEALEQPTDLFFNINIFDLWKKEMLAIAAKFEFRPTDIVIMGLPRAGTTVIAELVWLLVNNLDYKGAEKYIGSRVPTLENLINFHILKMENPYISSTEKSIELDDLPDPRVIVTHLPLSYLPQLQRLSRLSPKVIFVDRDLKEIFASLYHYLHDFRKIYRGTIINFLELFMNKIDRYSPWIEQLCEFREKSIEGKVLYVLYRDIRLRFSKVIINVVQFLEIPVPSNPAFSKLDKHFDPYYFKQNLSVNHFNQCGMHGFIRICESGKSQDQLPKIVWCQLHKHVEKLKPNPFDLEMLAVDYSSESLSDNEI